MATYLIHKNLDGEPIGSWNDAGESAYAAGFDDQRGSGRLTVQDKGWGVPWSVFARRLAATTNFHEWWGVLEHNGTPEAALDDVRNTFFSRAASRTPRDR